MIEQPYNPDGRDILKRAAALAAVDDVEDGMVVGLGTGTTASFAIEALGRRALQGLRISVVASSERSAVAATDAGLEVRTFENQDYVDLGIDGADEIDPALRAIKGAGGALLREKIIAAAARRMIVIVDEGKQVAQLGAHALPIEVLPFGAGFTTRQIENLGAQVILRMAGDRPYRTDQQNFILDCRFGLIAEPTSLADQLSSIPGVLGHGLFLTEIDAVYVGRTNGVIRLDDKP